MRVFASVVMMLAACSGASSGDDRSDHVITTLAEDNYLWARRDPELVAMKLAKMQRDPFLWMRGTAAVFWRDVLAPGSGRASTRFGDPASSRVLLVGDPHPENLGTFRAADGTLVVDWNDFDSAGYGPFEVDVRRLAAGMIVAAAGDDDGLARELAHQTGLGYAQAIGELAAGRAQAPVGVGAEPYLDKLLAKALKKGDAHATLDELAPVIGGQRTMAFGDIDPVGADGVIEKRLVPVGAEAATWIETTLAQWRTQMPGEIGAELGRARRLGAGVQSYPVLRYIVVLAGPTASPDDDLAIELKEERDGVIIAGVPQLDVAPWPTPARRTVDAQRRLQARADSDDLLGSADLAPLSLRVQAETAYQKGVDHLDLAALDPAELAALSHRFGAMLGRAHGQASTEDGVSGWSVIAPLVGDSAAFADEVAELAMADAHQVVSDWMALRSVDLPSVVLP